MIHRHKRWTLYLLSFLFTLHFTIPVYVNSSFIADIISERFVGTLYTLASLLTIVAFFGVTKMLKEAGNYKLTIRFILIDLFALGILAFPQSPDLLKLSSIILHLLFVPLVYFNLDVLLQHYSTNGDTGGIRGMYLTLANLGWVVAPITASFLIGDSERYGLIYAASFFILIPIVLIIRRSFADFKDPPYEEIRIVKTFRYIKQDANTRFIFTAAFLLQFFFALMVIYFPIYLHEHIGMEWSKIGLLFSIALLPYVLLEAPLGRIADSWLGEKEILTLGFAITGAASISLFLLTSDNFLIWAAALFLSRVGASMVEIMSETYFFKITDARNIDLLSFFRIVRPLAYVIGPLIATVLLIFVPYNVLFIALSVLVLFGVRYSLAIKDTR